MDNKLKPELSALLLDQPDHLLLLQGVLLQLSQVLFQPLLARCLVLKFIHHVNTTAVERIVAPKPYLSQSFQLLAGFFISFSLFLCPSLPQTLELVLHQVFELKMNQYRKIYIDICIGIGIHCHWLQ